MKNWKEDKAWSDIFIPEIKSILGKHLIQITSKEEDMTHNADLIIFSYGDIRIACRIRRYGYYLQYPNQFTIRVDRPSGQKTEFDKIMAGWGNYFFYGFAHSVKIELCKWLIGNLAIFRKWINYYKSLNIEKGMLQKNTDGSSNFKAFYFNEMPSDFFIAEKEEIIESENIIEKANKKFAPFSLQNAVDWIEKGKHRPTLYSVLNK